MKKTPGCEIAQNVLQFLKTLLFLSLNFRKTDNTPRRESIKHSPHRELPCQGG